jgi:hypothetical protein
MLMVPLLSQSRPSVGVWLLLSWLSLLSSAALTVIDLVQLAIELGTWLLLFLTVPETV